MAYVKYLGIAANDGNSRSLGDSSTESALIGQLMSSVRVVPTQAAVAFWGVIGRDFVDDLGVGLQRAEPMGKALRDQHLHPICGTQAGRHVPTIARRSHPDVDSDVEIDPRTTRTSLSCACGGIWKCSPRTTPARDETEWLSCTNELTSALASNARRLKVSEKEPRSSRNTLAVTNLTSGIAKLSTFNAVSLP